MVKNEKYLAKFAKDDGEGIVKEFWLQCLEYRDELYRCCFKLMNSNPTEAEDALSRSMLHACKKLQGHGGKIANFKAWLMRLTHNCCIDIIRERSREVSGVDSIELAGWGEAIATQSWSESPDAVLEREEKLIAIRDAIAELPERLRDTFIEHFYEECSYNEIAEIQGISYANVCKRISQARKVLGTKLRGYFIGEEEETSASPSATLSSFGEQKGIEVDGSFATPPVFSADEAKARKNPAIEIETESAIMEFVMEVGAEKPENLKDTLESQAIENGKIHRSGDISSFQVNAVERDENLTEAGGVHLNCEESQKVRSVAREETIPLLGQISEVRGQRRGLKFEVKKCFCKYEMHSVGGAAKNPKRIGERKIRCISILQLTKNRVAPYEAILLSVGIRDLRFKKVFWHSLGCSGKIRYFQPKESIEAIEAVLISALSEAKLEETKILGRQNLVRRARGPTLILTKAQFERAAMDSGGLLGFAVS